MARVFDESVGCFDHQAGYLRVGTRVGAAVGIGGFGCLAGIPIADVWLWTTTPRWLGISLVGLSALAMLVLARWCFRHLNGVGFGSKGGPTSASAVARTLNDFPDDFRVVHNLATPFGNLDHVVVGPTGVYIIDRKNWRGTVTADGKGELTLNDRRLRHPYVDRFLDRVVEVQQKVRGLAPELDAYFQPLFVFTSARVEAGFGTTSTVHCIRDEQLYDYIVNKRFGKKLPAAEIEKIARTFLSLAHLEVESPENSAPVSPATRPATSRPLARRAGNRRLVGAGA